MFPIMQKDAVNFVLSRSVFMCAFAFTNTRKYREKRKWKIIEIAVTLSSDLCAYQVDLFVH